MPTHTAAEKRARAKADYDAFLAECPSRQLLEVIANKWVFLIVSALQPGPLRHSALQARIAGVSQKMLTQTLRSLERDGLVARTVTASVPVRVDYELTPLGRDLCVVVESVKGWAETNMARILANRAAHETT